MVTAELALALPGLVLVLAAAVTVQTTLAARATCSDAARAAARAAARGESEAVVRATAQRVSERITAVSVRREGSLVRVEVVARPPSVFARLAVPDVTATVVAADEAAR